MEWLVIGAGPAGQKAAIQAAKAGRSVAVVERGREVGGECVHRGTIPSKSLRETALQVARARAAQVPTRLPEGATLGSLLRQVGGVVDAHVAFQADQLERNGVVVLRGHARFVDPGRVVVARPGGRSREVTAEHVVVATGSVPWRPPGLEPDHEFVLDSDSVLSQPYLPRRLLVVGGGVIASEYATIFKQLGAEVTIVDRGERPVSFLDPDLSAHLQRAFEGDGCRYLPRAEIVDLQRGPVSVRATLRDGAELEVDKVLVAVGRTARLDGLGLRELGVETTRRGHLVVDEAYRTSIPHVYAVGDVIGFPALAATSMEQGRRCVRMALGLPVTDASHAFPVGIYTIPELASVGPTEADALAQHGEIRVGTCDFAEVARGQISRQQGMLKLVSTVDRRRLLAVHVAGDGATEVVHLGHLALLGGMSPSVFVDHTFNFPTLAEAYRIAGLALERPAAVRGGVPA